MTPPGLTLPLEGTSPKPQPGKQQPALSSTGSPGEEQPAVTCLSSWGCLRPLSGQHIISKFPEAGAFLPHLQQPFGSPGLEGI